MYYVSIHRAGRASERVGGHAAREKAEVYVLPAKIKIVPRIFHFDIKIYTLRARACTLAVMERVSAECVCAAHTHTNERAPL